MSDGGKRVWWSTLLAGAAGGGLASLAHWPLPWMTGALTAVALLRCLTSWPFQQLPGGRKPGQLIVGIGIGMYFSAEVLEQIMNYWPMILLGAAVPLLSSLGSVWWLRRQGEDRATAFFASMPGGSAEMVNLGQRNGADLSRVVAAQTIRVVIVVLFVPALFKFFLGFEPAPQRTAIVDWRWLGVLTAGGILLALAWSRLRQPNPWFFGPLLVSGAVNVAFAPQLGLPPGASQVAQVVIGCSLGCYFDRAFFRRAPVFLLHSASSTLLVIAVGLAGAYGLSWWGGIELRSMMLGMMPGGIAEMSLTAASLRLVVPLVTAMQITRLLLVLFCAEPLFQLWLRREQKR